MVVGDGLHIGARALSAGSARGHAGGRLHGVAGGGRRHEGPDNAGDLPADPDYEQ